MEEKKGAVTTVDGAIGNLKCVRPCGAAKYLCAKLRNLYLVCFISYY